MLLDRQSIDLVEPLGSEAEGKLADAGERLAEQLSAATTVDQIVERFNATLEENLRDLLESTVEKALRAERELHDGLLSIGSESPPLEIPKDNPQKLRRWIATNYVLIFAVITGGAAVDLNTHPYGGILDGLSILLLALYGKRSGH